MHKNLDRRDHYAVIFTSKLKHPAHGYEEMAFQIEELAKKQPGFLGVESARSDLGITVSYWTDQEAVKNWKEQLEHLKAQELGKSKWYDWYKVHVCKIERAYQFTSTD